jgi:hypothetical protein
MSDRWQLIRATFAKVVNLPEEARLAELRRLHPDDDDLVKEVVSLLDCLTRAEDASFLTPVAGSSSETDTYVGAIVPA